MSATSCATSNTCSRPERTIKWNFRRTLRMNFSTMKYELNILDLNFFDRLIFNWINDFEIIWVESQIKILRLGTYLNANRKSIHNATNFLSSIKRRGISGELGDAPLGPGTPERELSAALPGSPQAPPSLGPRLLLDRANYDSTWRAVIFRPACLPTLLYCQFCKITSHINNDRKHRKHRIH